MNDLKMGCKHNLLQRLQGLEMAMPYRPQSTEQNPSETNATHVTDFSIQRILGETKTTDATIPAKNIEIEKTKNVSPFEIITTTTTTSVSNKLSSGIPSPTTTTTTTTTTSSTSQFQVIQPVAKKAFNPSDILDLSTNKSSQYPYSVTAATTATLPINHYNYNNYPTRLPYDSLHPGVLAAMAAVNAQKFYSQFLPHMFAAGFYNTNANHNNNNNNNNRLPSAIPSHYTKRYFAPYVINPPTPQRTTTAPPIPATSPTQQRETNLLSTSGRINNNKYSCTRSDCLECLNIYYRNVASLNVHHHHQQQQQQQQQQQHLSFKTSIALPASTAINSTATGLYRIKSKACKEATAALFSPSSVTSNISALNTTTTNIPLDNGSKMSGSILFSPSLAMSPNAEEISYKCCICDKVFGCSQTLQAHEKTHKSPRYECSDCGKGFSQLRNYKYHLSVHRGTKEFAAECPECRKTFNDKGYLSSHMKIHRNKKEYQCPYCPKSFNQRVAFNMHVRIHTGVKPHKCVECGKRFSRKMLLKQHMRTHSGEKPYQCSVCGKSFADRSNMTLHHRLHSGIKPFNCPICPKAFTKKHHLKTHLNYHTGCKPYVCPHPNCHQAFTQSSNMRTHAKKCQYRPLQLTYPAVSISTPAVEVAMAAATKATSFSNSSATSATQSPSMIISGNLTMVQPSNVTVPGLAVTTTAINSLFQSNNNGGGSNNSIPTTTLTAGIRMLNTIASVSPSASTFSTSIPFPPSQQPLLSTLRPF